MGLSSAMAGVIKFFHVEAEKLDVDSRRAAFKLDLWEDHGFLHFVCCLIDDERVFLEIKSCLCSVSREVIWKVRLCRFPSLLSYQYSYMLCRIEAFTSSINISLRA